MTSYADFVAGVESPTGEDNRMGSGAFSKYQFMPATAAGLAQRTAWGQGVTPANVKAAVMGDPTGGRANELFKLYNADSSGALAKAGLPADQTSMLALHRFGQAGGTSLLQAPGQMPVQDWVKSVNWGPRVGADAVIKQNGLGQYANVDDMRRRFLGGGASAPKSADPSIAAIVAPQDMPEPAAAPLIEAQPQGVAPSNMLAAQDLLASAFAPPKAVPAPPQPLPPFRYRGR